MLKKYKEYKRQKAITKAQKSLLSLNLHGNRMPSLVAGGEAWHNYSVAQRAIKHHQMRLERELKELCKEGNE